MRLTPWQFKLYLEGYAERKRKEHDHKAWAMWTNAALSNASGKKFPSLDKFLSKENKPEKKLNEKDLIAHLKAYQNKYKEVQGNG